MTAVTPSVALSRVKRWHYWFKLVLITPVHSTKCELRFLNINKHLKQKLHILSSGRCIWITFVALLQAWKLRHGLILTRRQTSALCTDVTTSVQHFQRDPRPPIKISQKSALSIAAAEQSKISGCRQNNKYLNFQADDDETCGRGVEQQRSDKSTEKNPLKVQETLLSAAQFPSCHFTFHFTGFMLWY